MYTCNIEIYFFEDDKTVTYSFHAESLEEVKKHNVEKMVSNAGSQYSMMTSEVVVTATIECNGEYVDSDEIFCTYNAETGCEILVA